MSPPETPAPTLPPPPSGVTVRLYNPGFGDCILLAFRAEDARARYLLIDCGVHGMYPGGKQKIRRVARDIAAATGRRLDLVVATHEHSDHLSGFEHAREVFDTIDLDQLWLAWTEDPSDPLARRLKELYGLRMRALAAALGLADQTKKPYAEALRRVQAFEYTEGKSEALDYLRAKAKKKLQGPEDYRRPGEAPLTLPGVKGVKVYILGPPREAKWFKMLEKKGEMYPELAALHELDAFTIAALAAAGTGSLEEAETQLFQQSCPFDASLEISPEAAAKHPEYGEFFRTCYGFSDKKGHGPAWRRVDTSWLSVAEQLALDINKKTNNTSLVLAFELTETQPRKVLLFAADAQVGNWLSWQTLSWPGGGSDNSEVVTAQDLLRRTVFYKVGHHGSRNATLSHKGLELMDSPELVAMLPVDEKWANDINWKHPAPKVLEALKVKARGRVLRSDEIPPQKPAEATDEAWDAFVRGLDWDRSPDKLWVQFTVPG